MARQSLATAAASWRAGFYCRFSPLPGGCWLSARMKFTLANASSDIVDSSNGDSSSGPSCQVDQAAIVLPMPKLSHAMTSGRIARWHVKEGAPVAMYDILLTVETESLVEEAYRVDQFAGTVALLVESQEEGHVARLLAAEGEEVSVGKPIAVLCEGEQDVEAVREDTRSGTFLGGVGNVYEQSARAPLRLLEWQSYLKEGPKSTGCL